MKSFLGGLLLMMAIVALVLTVVYHTSVNSELRFEPRDSHEEYINTRRSYRPRITKTPPPPAPVPTQPTQLPPDEDVAEEVEE